ncbi:MAG: WbqC family protein [Alphaproteobacteria bacterium]
MSGGVKDIATPSLQVAIHQPNYFPWLGYFRKIAEAEMFVFLDDVQFSKNSYINRVQIADASGSRWLTIPVSVHLGMRIDQVKPAHADWRTAHLSSLHNAYRGASCFRTVWRDVEAIYAMASGENLAAINQTLVQAVARHLGLSCKFHASSSLGVGDAAGDVRLAALVAAIDPNGTYLSGKGGAKYQNPDTFSKAGLSFRYSDFDHPVYSQGREPFQPGLSVLDAAFHLGWPATARLITNLGA